MEPGTYIVWDAAGRRWHVWLLLRPATDADIKKSGHSQWGYPAKNEFGQYWHYYDLCNGCCSITMDNSLNGWERLPTTRE